MVQYDNEIESTGLVDPATANLLGYDVPGAAAPATPPAPATDPEAAAPADPATPDLALGSDTEAAPSAAEPEPEAPADPEPASDAGADDPAPEPQN